MNYKRKIVTIQEYLSTEILRQEFYVRSVCFSIRWMNVPY
jgi:hypothetical protein